MKNIVIDATIDYIKGYSQCQKDTDQQTKELREEIEAKDKYIQDYKIQTDILISDMREEIERLKENKWISVEERLPPKNGFYICCKHNGLVLGLYFSADKEFRYGEQEQTSQVTHWQPLPNNPI